MAARVREETGIEVELLRGWLGELTFWVDGRKVARKGLFSSPDDEFFVAAIRKGLSCTSTQNLKSSIS